MAPIATQLEQVRKRIDKACQEAGRDPQSVTLLAVSKTFGPSAVIEAVQAGQRAFGENYVQEGLSKILALRQWAAEQSPVPPLQWHCIGPLQSNKSRVVAEHFDWVHSVDRLKIAQRLSEQRPAHLHPLQVCLQVNIDGGAGKSGLAPDEALALALQLALGPPRRL
jgi:pyridoxal phosphate enzyme (YggS family)